MMRSFSLRLLTLAFLTGIAPAQSADPLAPDTRKLVDASVRASQEKNQREEAQRYLSRLETADPTEYQSLLGALRMMQLPPDQGVPIFAGLLDHEADLVKQIALQSLAEYGPASEASVPRVSALLVDDRRDWFVRGEAAATLARIAPTTTSARLISDRLLARRDPVNTELRMLEALGALGDKAEVGLRAAESYLRSPHSSLQFAAFNALGRIMAGRGAPAFEASALTALDSASPADQALTLLSLQNEGASGATAAARVVELLADSHPPYLRCALLRTLATIGSGDPKAVTALLMAMADKDRVISDVAVAAFRTLTWSDERLTTPLIEGLRDKHPLPRLHGARALRAFGERAADAVPIAVELLQAADDRVATEEIGAVLDLLRAIGPKAAAAERALLGLLPVDGRAHQNRSQIDSHYLRAYALMMLTELNAADRALPFAIEFVATADASSAHEFAAGAMAIGALGQRGKAALPHLIRALQPEFRDHPVTFESFMKAVDFRKEHTSARREAIRALVRLGPDARSAIPALEALIAINPAGSIQKEAAAAVKAIRGE